MTMKSLNLKASIGWPFVERLSIPEDVIELKIQYDGCLRKISIFTKSCLLKLLLVLCFPFNSASASALFSYTSSFLPSFFSHHLFPRVPCFVPLLLLVVFSLVFYTKRAIKNRFK